MTGTPSNLVIKIFRSITKVDERQWDELSAGSPFQSYGWYAFGERVMKDCSPFYLMAYADDQLVGRAALWEIRNEPLPSPPGLGRTLLLAILRRWPLLICRSPLANASGLILPSGALRGATLQAIAAAAFSLSRENRCLALIFDFLTKAECAEWQGGFRSIEVPDPGTLLQNRWQSMDDYLQSGNKKDRQHYKRTLREAQKLGITLERSTKVQDVESALRLIEGVDKRYGNPPNPWMRSLLENLEAANGIWLEAKQHGKLVGCGALFFDNSTQLTTALGLADDVLYVYLLLAYVSLEEAFTRNVRALRWGSGAYELKQNLGFEMEHNNNTVVTSPNFVLRFLLNRFLS